MRAWISLHKKLLINLIYHFYYLKEPKEYACRHPIYHFCIYGLTLYIRTPIFYTNIPNPHIVSDVFGKNGINEQPVNWKNPRLSRNNPRPWGKIGGELIISGSQNKKQVYNKRWTTTSTNSFTNNNSHINNIYSIMIHIHTSTINMLRSSRQHQFILFTWVTTFSRMIITRVIQLALQSFIRQRAHCVCSKTFFSAFVKGYQLC